MPTNATISSRSAPSSAPSSPRNRLKFLCSHGGKILLRPADGHLKYVGGETRVISVPRDIPFQEVMKRLTYLIDGEMILKYQLVSEDLDALVSVRSDEDLLHMFDEIEHYEVAGCPRMRAFLFPVNHGSTEESQMEPPLPPDLRYIYSINGINTKLQLGSLASSSCSSPRSPDSCAAAAEAVMMMNTTEHHVVLQNNHQNMHKIQSSPNICHNLSIPQQSSHYLQLLPQCGHKSPNPPFDTHRSSTAVAERLVPIIRSVGRPVDGIRIQGDTAPPPHQYYYASGEANRASGCCTKCMHHHDSCAHFSDRRTIDRQATLP